MLPFRCAGCGRPSAQAAVCSSCGSRKFTLTREAAEREVVAPPPPVPIEQARERRRRRMAT